MRRVPGLPRNPNVSVGIKRADYAKILESVIDNSVDFGARDLALFFRKDKTISRAALAFIDIARKHKSDGVRVSGTK
jgi:hypothetical protein